MHAAEPLAASGGGVRTTSLLVASPHNIVIAHRFSSKREAALSLGPA